MKVLFFFGAGASHGCGGTNSPPPLGNSLFSSLRKEFPSTWGSLPENLKEKFDKNFEEGMETIWQRYSSNIAILMQQMAVFFSGYYVSNKDENLYVKILLKLQENELLNKSIFSTLNYECLLEHAVSLLGKKINYFTLAEDSVNILKLHGSCNFVNKGIQATRGVQYTAGVVFDGGLNVIQPHEVRSYCFGNNSLYPAMSIFMHGKQLQISKSSIENIQKTWSDVVLKAEKVFIIGVYPNLWDKHIWDVLSKTNTKIYYCGSKEGFKKWQTAKNRQDIFMGEKFYNCFDQIEREIVT